MQAGERREPDCIQVPKLKINNPNISVILIRYNPPHGEAVGKRSLYTSWPLRLR